MRIVNYWVFKNIALFFIIIIFISFKIAKHPTKKKNVKFFLLQKSSNIFKKKMHKSSNLHERCGIGWIDRKTKFQIFPIFIFRVMVIFALKCPQFSINFYDNSKNEKTDFSFVSGHCASYKKTKSKLRGEGVVCISLVG